MDIKRIQKFIWHVLHFPSFWIAATLAQIAILEYCARTGHNYFEVFFGDLVWESKYRYLEQGAFAVFVVEVALDLWAKRRLRKTSTAVPYSKKNPWNEER